MPKIPNPFEVSIVQYSLVLGSSLKVQLCSYLELLNQLPLILLLSICRTVLLLSLILSSSTLWVYAFKKSLYYHLSGVLGGNINKCMCSVCHLYSESYKECLVFLF